MLRHNGKNDSENIISNKQATTEHSVDALIEGYDSLSPASRRDFCGKLIQRIGTNELTILSEAFYCDFISRLPSIPVEQILLYLDDDSLSSAVEVSTHWSSVIHSYSKVLRNRCERLGIVYTQHNNDDNIKTADSISDKTLETSCVSRYFEIRDRFTRLADTTVKGKFLKSEAYTGPSCSCSPKGMNCYGSDLLHWCPLDDSLTREAIPLSPPGCILQNTMFGRAAHPNSTSLCRLSLFPSSDSHLIVERFPHGSSLPLAIVAQPGYGRLFAVGHEERLVIWHWGGPSSSVDGEVPLRNPAHLLELDVLSGHHWTRMDIVDQPVASDNQFYCRLVVSCSFAVVTVLLHFSRPLSIFKDQPCQCGPTTVHEMTFNYNKMVGVAVFSNRLVLASSDTLYSITKGCFASAQSPPKKSWQVLAVCQLECNLSHVQLIGAGERLFLLSGWHEQTFSVDVCSYLAGALWRIPVLTGSPSQFSPDVEIRVTDIGWLHGLISADQISKQGRILFFVKNRRSPTGAAVVCIVGLRL